MMQNVQRTSEYLLQQNQAFQKAAEHQRRIKEIERKELEMIAKMQSTFQKKNDIIRNYHQITGLKPLKEEMERDGSLKSFASIGGRQVGR